jgi:hypothetical protein
VKFFGNETASWAEGRDIKTSCVCNTRHAENETASCGKYHTTPCNNPEDQRFHQHRGGSLKSRLVHLHLPICSSLKDQDSHLYNTYELYFFTKLRSPHHKFMQARSGGGDENPTPLRFYPGPVQPVASRCTDYAIRPHKYLYT